MAFKYSVHYKTFIISQINSNSTTFLVCEIKLMKFINNVLTDFQLSGKQKLTNSCSISYLTFLFTYSNSYSSFWKNPRPDFLPSFLLMNQNPWESVYLYCRLCMTQLYFLKTFCFPTPFLLVLSVYPSSINTLFHLGFVNYSLSAENVSF